MRLRATYVFEYDAYLDPEEESLAPEEIARRDEESFGCGDLDAEDVNAYSCLSITVEPAHTEETK